MPDPAGTATPEAPLVVTDRLTGCDVLGAVASQAVNVSASGASHSAPRTRDRSIMCTSPIENPSNIVPRVSCGRVRDVTCSSPVSHVDPRHEVGAGARRFPLLSEHLVGPRVSSARERCSRSGVRRISWAQVQPRDLLSTLLWPGFYRMIVQPRFRAPVRSERMKSLFTAPVAAEARLLIPELRAGDLVRSYAGNRAQVVSRSGDLVDNIVVRRSGGSVHVLNSPPASRADFRSVATSRRCAFQCPDGGVPRQPIMSSTRRVTPGSRSEVTNSPRRAVRSIA